MEIPYATQQEIAREVLALEIAALDRWASGDPSGFLNLCADEVVYFDPFQERRVNGKKELAALYETIRGKVHVDVYELLDPRVEATDDMAVLTFNYVSELGDEKSRWNCTEVFQLIDGQWKIIHTHWSFTQPSPGEAA